MEQTKKQKTIRIVGLVALTILVIVGVILTIYFVQKADNKEYITGEVNQEIETDDYIFKVTNFVCDNIDQPTGYTKAAISIEIKAKKDMKVKAGDVITEENVRSIRPGFGLHPRYLKDVIGKKFVRDVEKGERFSLNVCI